MRRIKAHFKDDPRIADIRPEVVEHHIKSSEDTAPGPDGVKYSHLKALNDD